MKSLRFFTSQDMGFGGSEEETEWGGELQLDATLASLWNQVLLPAQ